MGERDLLWGRVAGGLESLFCSLLWLLWEKFASLLVHCSHRWRSMAPKRFLTFSVASVVEDVLQQHGAPLSDGDLASRKAEEAG